MQKEHSVPENSTQLKAGQKFHHKGKSGIVYFSLSVEQTKDGSIFPKTVTGPACNVLPIELDEKGQVVAAHFLLQKGRPEVGEEEVLKATGSFCDVEESAEMAAIRSLKEKVGIVAQTEDLIFTGRSYGFGPQFQFPVELFVIKKFKLTDTIPNEGCDRLRLGLGEIAEAQSSRRFFNSETVDLIATIMLRNTNRGAYSW